MNCFLVIEPSVVASLAIFLDLSKNNYVYSKLNQTDGSRTLNVVGTVYSMPSPSEVQSFFIHFQSFSFQCTLCAIPVHCCPCFWFFFPSSEPNA